MTRFVILAVALSFVAPVTESSLNTEAPAPEWHTDFKLAQKASKRTGRPILADFTGSDWCSWCKKLDKEVFGTREFQTWATRNVILFEADFPRKKRQRAKVKTQNQALAKQFGVKGFPTILFIGRDGKELGRSGYLKGGAKNWIARAAAIVNAVPSEWHTSLEDALIESRRSRKPILANFSGSDWCEWCHTLRDEVFTTSTFAAWAKKNVVLLELDFPQTKAQSAKLKKQNKELAKKFGIKAYPTIVFLDDRGQAKGKLGYKRGGATVWIGHAEKILKR